MLSKVSARPNMGLGFKKAPQTQKIPCLMFADDSLLLCKATNSACHNLLKVISDFCRLSGQLVNFHKSSIIFSKNITHNRKNSFDGIFNMTKSSALGRYLGAHFSGFTPNKADYARIMQKNENRINSWQANFLSKAERTTLIQSNLEALSAYIFSSFLLPRKSCLQLDGIHR